MKDRENKIYYSLHYSKRILADYVTLAIALSHVLGRPFTTSVHAKYTTVC